MYPQRKMLVQVLLAAMHLKTLLRGMWVWGQMHTEEVV